MSPDFQEEYDDSWIDEFEGMAYEDLPYKTNRHFSHLPKNKRNEARQAYHVELRSKYRKEWLRNNKKSTLDWFQKSTANAICGYDIYFCSKSHFVSGPRVRIPGKWRRISRLTWVHSQFHALKSRNKAQKLLAERNGQEVSDDLPVILQSRGLAIPDIFEINDSGCKELELPNGKVECFKDKKQVFGEEKFAKVGFQINALF